MKKTFVIIFVVVVAIALYGWGIYNKMVIANEAVDNQWAQVETQFQRRFDLIPNLVESVKGAMQQEQKVFGDLAEARTRYAGAKTTDAKAEAVGGVESAFARLLVIMENYPQLKSVETVQTLMAQLEGTENRVSVERKRFNDLARDFNVLIKQTPANLFAGYFGFREKQYIKAVVGSENTPAVKF
ncbi:MAG: LemA family protein [Patescibacteria group bacterium]